MQCSINAVNVMVMVMMMMMMTCSQDDMCRWDRGLHRQRPEHTQSAFHAHSDLMYFEANAFNNRQENLDGDGQRM